MKRRRRPRSLPEPRSRPEPWLTAAERHALAVKALELVRVRRGAPDVGTFADVASHLLAELVDRDQPELTIARLTGLAEELAGIAAQLADGLDGAGGGELVAAWLEQVPAHPAA